MIEHINEEIRDIIEQYLCSCETEEQFRDKMSERKFFEKEVIINDKIDAVETMSEIIQNEFDKQILYSLFWMDRNRVLRKMKLKKILK